VAMSAVRDGEEHPVGSSWTLPAGFAGAPASWCCPMPFLPCARGPYTRNEEPTLAELLSEPIVRLVMARDRVKEADVRRLTKAAAKERLVWQSD
jgi:hypothetical protein